MVGVIKVTIPAQNGVFGVATFGDILAGPHQFVGPGSEFFDGGERLRFGFGSQSAENFAEVQSINALLR